MLIVQNGKLASRTNPSTKSGTRYDYLSEGTLITCLAVITDSDDEYYWAKYQRADGKIAYSAIGPKDGSEIWLGIYERPNIVTWALDHWDDIQYQSNGQPAYFEEGIASPYGRCASFVLHCFFYGYDVPWNKIMVGKYGQVGNLRNCLRSAGFSFTEFSCTSANGKLACTAAKPGDVLLWENEHVALIVDVKSDGTLVCVQSNPMLGPNRVSPDGTKSDGTYPYGRGFKTIGKVLHITGLDTSGWNQ